MTTEESDKTRRLKDTDKVMDRYEVAAWARIKNDKQSKKEDASMEDKRVKGRGEAWTYLLHEHIYRYVSFWPLLPDGEAMDIRSAFKTFRPDVFSFADDVTAYAPYVESPEMALPIATSIKNMPPIVVEDLREQWKAYLNRYFIGVSSRDKREYDPITWQCATVVVALLKDAVGHWRFEHPGRREVVTAQPRAVTLEPQLGPVIPRSTTSPLAVFEDPRFPLRSFPLRELILQQTQRSVELGHRATPITDWNDYPLAATLENRVSAPSQGPWWSKLSTVLPAAVKVLKHGFKAPAVVTPNLAALVALEIDAAIKELRESRGISDWDDPDVPRGKMERGRSRSRGRWSAEVPEVLKPQPWFTHDSGRKSPGPDYMTPITEPGPGPLGPPGPEGGAPGGRASSRASLASRASSRASAGLAEG